MGTRASGAAMPADGMGAARRMAGGCRGPDRTRRADRSPGGSTPGPVPYGGCIPTAPRYDSYGAYVAGGC